MSSVTPKWRLQVQVDPSTASLSRKKPMNSTLYLQMTCICPVSMSVTWHKERSWTHLSSSLIQAGLISLQIFPYSHLAPCISINSYAWRFLVPSASLWWRRQWHPTQIFLPGKSHGWRRVVGKSRTRLSKFTFTFHFHALEKEMPTHSSVLAWRIPGMGEPGGLPSMGSHRVGHDWCLSSSSSS